MHIIVIVMVRLEIQKRSKKVRSSEIIFRICRKTPKKYVQECKKTTFLTDEIPTYFGTSRSGSCFDHNRRVNSDNNKYKMCYTWIGKSTFFF